MVYQPAQRSALNFHLRRLPVYIFTFVVSTLIGFCVGRLIFHHEDTTSSTDSATSAETSTEPTPAATSDTPTLINLQSTVDAWLQTITGTAGVVIYDLDNQKIVAESNSSQPIGTASLYKLFVAYEGYRLAEQGKVNLNEPNYVGTYTRGECLDLMIRESYSPCAETMWAEIGQDNLNEIIASDFGLQNTYGLTSTPLDIATMMKIYYQHPDLSAKTWKTIQDTLLNQPPTTYNWRQGLPSGFSDTVKVYNKVGFEHSGVGNIWNLYHDAAIVEFPDLGRHYVVTIMTSHVTPEEIAALGTALETAIRTHDQGETQ